MIDNYTDLRIIRTKESIRKALVELIEEKGFEAIAVKDITTRAQINRGTFYAHYENKFDLITKCEDEIMYELAKIAKQNIPNILEAIETNSATVAPLSLETSFFEYLDENSAFMKAVLGPKGDLSFQVRFKDFMRETMFGERNALIKDQNLLVPKHYLAPYVASAHIGVIQQWLDNGRKESPQEIAHILSTITVKGPFLVAGLKK